MSSLNVAKDLRTDLATRTLDHVADRNGPGSGGFGVSFPKVHTELQSGLPLRFRGDQPVPTQASPSRQAKLRMKRAMDVVISGLALIALMPLFALVALLIKITSPGPVLFRQMREGLDGEMFGIYKFRSMDASAGDASGVEQTVEGDTRVTAFGRLLRRSSVDELPQLLNVFLGEMSLVGPRPHVKGMLAAGISYRSLVPYYDERLQMVPGLTGWAQVNGLRGPTVDEMLARARVDHDIAYIQNFSLWLDVKVMVMTVTREFLRGSGD